MKDILFNNRLNAREWMSTFLGEPHSCIYGDASDSPAVLTSTRDGGVSSSARYTNSPAGGMSIIQETTTHDGTGLPPSWWTLPVSTSATTTTTVTLQLSNPHGDIVATIPNTTNTTGTEVSAATAWSGFGLAQTGSVPDRIYGWEGTNQRDTLNPASLITMGARLYNQTTGRFLTIDPVSGGNANPYMYPADPVNEEDLTGEANYGHQGAFCAQQENYRGCAYSNAGFGKGYKLAVANANKVRGKLRRRGMSAKRADLHYNAVLHATWIGLAAKYHGYRFANGLGIAHEKDGTKAGETWGTAESRKDLANNSIGIYYGRLQTTEADFLRTIRTLGSRRNCTTGRYCLVIKWRGPA